MYQSSKSRIEPCDEKSRKQDLNVITVLSLFSLVPFSYTAIHPKIQGINSPCQPNNKRSNKDKRPLGLFTASYSG